ncbi:Alpha/Beta hydrolase protein [Boeremia exigua]|uniref:Alpha/Beta hydrolase protein n=1 Tax=Boeremia exigua TaxID=749465 RepID=UPI001E8E2AC8|nr:Alpha/Beta hydrolase protein [Boeremia exigua]KAH6642797.1 Alpha/Beta hydrolase protein [Boeremia exigua]
MTAARRLEPIDKDGNRRYKRIRSHDQVENPLIKYVLNQYIAIVPEFALECGTKLFNVPVAYQTYGTLGPGRDNAILVCHAFTGSADLEAWWNPLVGSDGDAAFDTSRFFVVCINCLGSPYGSASPVTAVDGDLNKGYYGPDFPITTIRDDVKLFKLLLDDLGVKQVAAVVGGSMGGMHALEFAYFGKQYVRTMVSIASCAQSSAWCLGWNEAQRQSIFSDSKYNGGYYDFDDPPVCGLGAARMNALLTYRSWNSFEDRFGRRENNARHVNGNIDHQQRVQHTNLRSLRSDRIASRTPDEKHDSREYVSNKTTKPDTIYAAQSYLRYQGGKFTKRFDANCYIAITRKIDSHDVARGRASTSKSALEMIQQPTLILGILDDGLFTYQEQRGLSAAIPNAQLKTIDSDDGHDGFLLEHEQINMFLNEFFERELGELTSRPSRERSTLPAKR